MIQTKERINALSVDFEEWFHPLLIQKNPSCKIKKYMAKDSLEWLLSELVKRNIKITFFILGELIREYKDFIIDIYKAGHEIAFHGYNHSPLWDQNSKTFLEQIRTFKKEIQSVIPAIKIYGYRAPTFSMDNGTLWALQILKDEGFCYDSSVFPFKNHVYGVANAPRCIYKPDFNDLSIENNNSDFYEFPMTVFKTLFINIPVSGGFYLRILPLNLQIKLLKIIQKERPFVLYLHPWEIEPNIPKLNLGIINNFITYHGIKSTRKKICSLLDNFKFSTMINVIKNYEGTND